MCKFVAGLFFSGYGAFHAVRAGSLWSRYRFSDKLFNIAAVSVVFGIAGLNFNAALSISQGKESPLIEFRPSYS